MYAHIAPDIYYLRFKQDGNTKEPAFGRFVN